jgi:hypothetical protein
MRAFAGGYYKKLRGLYDHLGLQYRAQAFLFAFSKLSPNRSDTSKQKSTPYFIHSSNNHRFPPLRPHGMPTRLWLVETFYLLVLYTYFTICCIMRPPKSGNGGETLQQYLDRIWIPHYFTTYYILPLISSVNTCPHAALLQFPACDVINYKRQTNGMQHYVLSNGVGSVQEKLVEGLETRFSTHVISVEPQANGVVKLKWRNSKDTEGVEIFTEEFDHVVLAVPPNVVGKIFVPLKFPMERIPTINVESTVHTDDRSIQTERPALGKSRGVAQSIFLRTELSTGRTESIHVQPSGVLVTTCPFTPIREEYAIQMPANFERVLRTPESRRIVNEIFKENQDHTEYRYTLVQEKSHSTWRNGDDGVWLVGGWCWDGMVLLEGCIVSSMRVANGLGVSVPF